MTYYTASSTQNYDEKELNLAKVSECLKLIPPRTHHDDCFPIIGFLAAISRELGEDLKKEARDWVIAGGSKGRLEDFNGYWKNAYDSPSFSLDKAMGSLIKEAQAWGFDPAEHRKQWLESNGYSNGSYRDDRPKSTKPQKQPSRKQESPSKEPIKGIKKEITRIPSLNPVPFTRVAKPYGYDLEYLYYYSETQRIKRIEFYNPEGDRIVPPKYKGKKEKTKDFDYQSLTDNGWIDKKIGEFGCYRLEEALNAPTDYILWVESEIGVDIAWFLGFPACYGKSNSQIEAIVKGCQKYDKTLGVLTDNDEEGQGYGVKLAVSASKIDLPYFIFELSQIWQDIPIKGDIVDWYKMMTAKNYTADQIGQQLADHLQSYLEAGYCPSWLTFEGDEEYQELKETLTTKKTKKQELLEKIEEYQQATDLVDKLLIKNEICSKFRLKSSEFEALLPLNPLENHKRQIIILDDFLSEESEAQSWLVPGFLPIGEMVILSALPKVGKTLLVTDLAYAVLTGEQFLGVTANNGKVLLITSDESPSTTRRRLKSRGFDTLPNRENMGVLTNFDINDLQSLDDYLKEFQPNLVLIDSLTSITRNSGISENDAEFAKAIYRLKEKLADYNCSSVLIHHNNKSKDNTGIAKLSGSGRISAAAWGIWIFEGQGDNRILSIIPRETEQSIHNLALNPKESWQDGIFTYKGEKDANEEQLSLSDRILAVLKENSPSGLEMIELKNLFPDNTNSLHNVVSRMVDRQIIGKRKSSTNIRSWVYYVPDSSQDNTTGLREENLNFPLNPPPLSLSQEFVSQNLESYISQDFRQIDNQIDTLIDTTLTPQNCQLPVNLAETIAPTEIDNKLTQIDNQIDSQIDRGGEGVNLPLNPENNTTLETGDRTEWEWQDYLNALTAERERIGLSQEDTKAYIKETYGTTFSQLTDSQIGDLLDRLMGMPNTVIENQYLGKQIQSLEWEGKQYNSGVILEDDGITAKISFRRPLTCLSVPISYLQQLGINL